MTVVILVIKEGIVMDAETKVRTYETRTRSSKLVYQT